MTTLTIDELRVTLQKDKVHFEFTKKDGTLRKALGTLNEELIPNEKKPKAVSKSSNLRFYDLEKEDWRSVWKDTAKIIWYNIEY